MDEVAGWRRGQPAAGAEPELAGLAAGVLEVEEVEVVEAVPLSLEVVDGVALSPPEEVSLDDDPLVPELLDEPPRLSVL